MNHKQIKEIRAELRAMRLHPHGIKYTDLVSIAKKAGRKLADRGSEPNYVREKDPQLAPPLSIPGHRGDAKVGTARSIIDALLEDLDVWEQFLDNPDF